eukprot:CAMPEP_0113950754 /NCGR_PEP_ID=MMETSP1339-20121228/82420_1 /TAXON_ID=94617 /ORGANISM="Fibrocapsa japonica" /LENGTH=191 /DNA_ID=CAMNT_0000958715 /DNA_START=120 /DNA_END=695 /DNA_ORIENTATION=+ /assembly_acc=CAM_ASM_000762
MEHLDNENDKAVQDVGCKLMESCKTGDLKKAAFYLWDLNACPNTQDPEGVCALDWAAACGHYFVAKILIDSGATVNMVDSHGNTPLHAAAEYGHPPVVRLLLEKGALLLANKQGQYAGDVFWMSVPREIRQIIKHMLYQHTEGTPASYVSAENSKKFGAEKKKKCPLLEEDFPEMPNESKGCLYCAELCCT